MNKEANIYKIKVELTIASQNKDWAKSVFWDWLDNWKPYKSENSQVHGAVVKATLTCVRDDIK